MGKLIKSYGCFLAVAMFSLVLLVGNSRDVLAAYEGGDVSNGGTITGTVKLVGDVPDASTLKVDKDQATCGHDDLPSEALMVSGDSSLQNAVVSITNISKGKKFAGGTPAIDQKGCVFRPHVAMIPQGSSIELLNSDDVMHNLHSWSMKNTAFNEGVAAHGNISKTFEFPETVKVTCDVHKWMTSWLIVQANPYYAITDANGKYKLEGVPAGTYTVQAWQESLGNATQEVTVAAGGEAKADFELEKKEKKRRERKKH
ncbi:MAG: carboxypeptidase regulatory-like domain-containing protein [Candidatus Scalindua sp.]|nr:carboxypeptidase regulatory-like domain-containing protein [Candidatus Scalindua sp.]MCR4344980.1 carboxypeptidase regulatory-like domain-containing protein [Candidatus Scalindua sp.]